MRSILQDETLRDVHYTFYYGQAPAKPQGRDIAAQVASLKHPASKVPKNRRSPYSVLRM